MTRWPVSRVLVSGEGFDLGDVPVGDVRSNRMGHTQDIPLRLLLLPAMMRDVLLASRLSSGLCAVSLPQTNEDPGRMEAATDFIPLGQRLPSAHPGPWHGDSWGFPASC